MGKARAATFDALYAQILAILPHAQMGEDNDGQIVIYTGLHEVQNGKLEEMDEQ